MSKYVDLFHSKRSLPTFCHRSSGIFEGMSGSALWLLYLQHSRQFLTNSSNCFDSPGTTLIDWLVVYIYEFLGDLHVFGLRLLNVRNLGSQSETLGVIVHLQLTILRQLGNMV